MIQFGLDRIRKEPLPRGVMDFSRGSSCLRMVNYNSRKVILGLRNPPPLSSISMRKYVRNRDLKGRRMIW